MEGVDLEEGRPYTAAELQKIVDFALDEGGDTWKTEHDDIVLACLFTVHSAGASLPELCRQSMKSRTRVPLQAWRILGPHGCMDVFLTLLNNSSTSSATVQTLRYVGGAEAYSALKRIAETSGYEGSLARQAVNAVENEPERWNYRGPNDLAVMPLRQPDARDRTIADVVVGRTVAQTCIRHAVSLLAHSRKALRHAAGLSLARTGYGADALYGELAQRWLDADLIELLASIGDNRARDLLLDSACSDSWLGKQCYEALSRLDWRDSLDTLVEFFRRNPFQSYRIAPLFRAAGDMGVERLLELFGRDEEMRRRGGPLLALVAGQAALPMLHRALSSPYRDERTASLEGLTVLGSGAIPVLVESMSTIGNVERQRAALRAIAAIAEKGKSAAVEAATFSCLRAMLARRATRAEALRVLRSLGTTDSHSLLIDVLDSDYSVDADAAINLCESLMRSGVAPPLELIDTVVKDVPHQNSSGQRKSLQLLLLSLRFPTVATTSARAFLLFIQDDELAELTLQVLRTPEARRRIMAAAIPADLANSHAWLRFFNKIALNEREGRGPRFEDPGTEARKQSGPEFQAGYAISRSVTTANMSVTAPRIVVPGSRFILAVWVHSSGDEAVRRHATALNSGPVRMHTKQSVNVPDSSVLNVTLQLPCFELDEDADTIYWQGGGEAIGNCTFAATVPPQLAYGSYPGKASFWLTGMRIAKLDFLVEVGDKESALADVTTDEELSRSAFASYADAELPRVLARIQGMRAVLPDLDVFVDVVSLRSGDNWKERIFHEIVDRDLFLLFWSVAASRSEWVQAEWRAALAAKGLEGISPVPLEPPTVSPPPPELSSLHFHDWTLALNRFSARSASDQDL